jgi:hypothetical protein
MRIGLALVSLACAAPLGAQDSAGAPAQIEYLLQTIGRSGCDFYRNGSWYQAARAEQHLRLKYRNLQARGFKGSAEEFVDAAATRSSISGQPYAVRCPGAAAVAAAQWLLGQLAQYRKEHQLQ